MKIILQRVHRTIGIDLIFASVAVIVTILNCCPRVAPHHLPLYSGALVAATPALRSGEAVL